MVESGRLCRGQANAHSRARQFDDRNQVRTSFKLRVASFKKWSPVPPTGALSQFRARNLKLRNGSGPVSFSTIASPSCHRRDAKARLWKTKLAHYLRNLKLDV